MSVVIPCDLFSLSTFNWYFLPVNCKHAPRILTSYVINGGLFYSELFSLCMHFFNVLLSKCFESFTVHPFLSWFNGMNFSESPGNLVL